MHMGVTVSVISGKGGTGKTTLCAGIAACLAAEGKRVLCIDADIGLRNLDIALGMAEQPAVAFTDVTQGFCKLSDAAEHPALPGLFLLTAPVREQDALVEQQRFGALLREAREAFDWVLIDAAAGIGTSFRLATQFADRCIVAATPDPATLRDAACAADALALQKDQVIAERHGRDRKLCLQVADLHLALFLNDLFDLFPSLIDVHRRCFPQILIDWQFIPYLFSHFFHLLSTPN